MKAIVLTRKILANGAARKWYAERSCNGSWSIYRKEKERKIYESLLALGPGPGPDDVDRVIGNRSWTSLPTCGGCGKDGLEIVVQVGEDPDYESRTAYLCGPCLREAWYACEETMSELPHMFR